MSARLESNKRGPVGPVDTGYSDHVRRNILIVGHGRSGKDTAADLLHGKGRLLNAGSLSWHALPFMAKELGITPQKAWDERHAKRQFWKDHLDTLRAHDTLFLVKLALKHGNIVTGLRAREEMDAAQASGLFSSIVWIERPGTPVDPTVCFGPQDSTDILHNTGTLEDFEAKLLTWAKSENYL